MHTMGDVDARLRFAIARAHLECRPAMAYTEPVLLKRIPSDPAKRKLVNYDEYARTGGYAALRRALDMKPDDVIKTVTDSGLRGRGGAGFSAGQKWSFIPKEKKGPHYMAVNADESEPGTFKDRYLMDYDPHQLLEGIAIAAIATQCDVAYVGDGEGIHRVDEPNARVLDPADDHIAVAVALGLRSATHVVARAAG